METYPPWPLFSRSVVAAFQRSVTQQTIRQYVIRHVVRTITKRRTNIWHEHGRVSHRWLWLAESRDGNPTANRLRLCRQIRARSVSVALSAAHSFVLLASVRHVLERDIRL